MQRIVRVHHPDVEEALVNNAMLRFYRLRDLPEVRKKPSTSELIDWIAALERAGVSAQKLTDEIPFLGVLLKREQDLAALGKMGFH